MPTRVHKTICRLDYPVSFELLDRLGHHTQILHEATNAPPFTDANSSVDLNSHSSTNIGKVHGNPYRVGVTPTSIDMVVEFQEGISPDDIVSTPVVSVLDQVIRGLHQNLKVYNRVGMRSHVLVSHSCFTFSRLLETFLELISDVSQAINPVAQSKDLGIIIEGTDPDGRSLRALLGPYQSSEAKRYFATIDPPSSEALILDIDVWVSKIELPKFALDRFIRRHQQMVNKLSGNVMNRLLQRLQANPNVNS